MARHHRSDIAARQAHEGSDLDLVLRNPRQLTEPAAGHAELVDGLTDSMLPMLVDMHDSATLPTAFRDEIGRRYLLLKPAAVAGAPFTASAKT